MKMQHRIVTILLLAWVAMFAVSGFSQVFTAAGTTGPIDQTNSGIYNHRLTWTGAGTRTTCTVKLEQSIDGVTWTDLIAAQVCTTNGTATATGYANYVRMNVTALAGAGNTVYPRYDGTPVAATVGAVTIAPGSTVTADQGAVGANAWKVVGTGTAGTPGTAVLTVQGIGSGTAVPVSGTFTNTALSTAQAADIAGVTGPLVQASTLTTGSNPAYTTAKVNPLSISTIGGLRAEGVGAAGTAAGGVMSIQGVGGGTAVPISGTVTATVTGATATVSQGLSTAYDSTLTGLGNSVAALTATTTVVQMLYCNNSDTSAHTVTVTNTAGGNYVGPSFSIPALSNVVFWESQVGLKMVGVKWGADTANKVYCQISGLQ